MSFKYQVGDTVEYKSVGGKVGLFTIVRWRPVEDGAGDRKYHIKSEQESFERCVPECELALTDKPESMYADVFPLRRLGGHH
jgi:hypothetical protein